MGACFICQNTGKDKESRHYFGPPKGSEKEWIEIVSKYRADGKVFNPRNRSHKVCILHFKEEEVLKNDPLLINGEWVYWPRSNWGLKPGTLPTIFTGLKEIKKRKKSSSIRPQGCLPPPIQPAHQSRPPSHSYSRKRKLLPTTKEKETKNVETSSSSSSLPPPPPAPETACFVCCSKESLPRTKRAAQYDYEDILVELLNIPQKLTQKYLKQFGTLEGWIFFCKGCLNIFDEWKRLKDKILLLQKELEVKQDKIFTKITPTHDSHTNVSVSSAKRCKTNHNQTHQEDAISDLRRHISRLACSTDLSSQQHLNTSNICGEIVLNESGKMEDDDNDDDIISLHSFDDDIEEIPVDINELSSSSKEKAAAAHITVSDEVNQSKVYYCGLCDDFSAYKSEALLAFHQKKVHSQKNDTITTIPKSKVKKYIPHRIKKLVPTYSCPNCPEVKDYRLNRYIQHLAIHQRRPFKCTECSEFLPESEDAREQHWNDKHLNLDKGSSLDDEKFLKINFNPGEIWTCLGFGCFKGFPTKEEKNDHEAFCEILESQLDKTKFEQIKCLQCQEGPFRSRLEWRFHRALAHPEADSLSCLYCDESFAEPIKDSELVLRNDTKLMKHLKSEHRAWDFTDFRIYDDCEPCGIVFCPKLSKSVEKSDHDFTIHGIAKDKTYSCKVCSFTSSISSEIGLHMEKEHFLPSAEENLEKSKGSSSPSTSSSSFNCFICRKTFISRNSIPHHLYVKHQLNPDGAEITSCPHTGCKYKTVSKWHVNQHFRLTHEAAEKRLIKEQMPLVNCHVCGDGFKNATRLKIHLRRDHHGRPRRRRIRRNATESLRLSCKYCKKTFKSPRQKRLHEEAVHENKESKPFKCDICAANFSTELYLKSHNQRVHLNPKIGIQKARQRRSISIQPRKKRKPLFKSKLVPLYSCPNCPEIKNYRPNRYIQHLAIHQRRPYKCCECSQFLPEDEALRDQHWNDNHPDKEPLSGQDKFVKIKLDPGQIWKCIGYGCFKGFFNKEERDQHELTCIILKRKLKKPKFQELSCLHCHEGPFRSRVEWRFHRALRHPEVDSLSCLYCDEKFSEKIKDSDLELRNDPRLFKHMNACHNTFDWNDRKVYEECEPCGIVFKFKAAKNMQFPEKSDHDVNIHGIPRNEVYSCKVCSFKGKMYQYLEAHVETHYLNVEGKDGKQHFSQNRVCEHCGKTCQGLTVLRHHIYKYHKIVPEGCEVTPCPYSSSSNDTGCECKYVTKWHLRVHCERVHKDTSGTESQHLFVCDICGKACKNQTGWRLHHNKCKEGLLDKSDVSFSCSYCGKSFKSKQKCRMHELALHENRELKPFVCDLCGNSYATNYYLSYHKRYYHDKKKRAPRKK